MIAKAHTNQAILHLSRRGLLGGLAGTVAALLPGLPVAATTDPEDEPIQLVDGWLLRRSDLALLVDGRGRHRT